MTSPDMSKLAEELLPCPFCNRTMMFRKALWPSDGNTDAIIHAAPGICGLVQFDDGTTDESIIAKWNTRSPALDERTVEACAKCVPTNWLDSLLTGPDAPKPPLDNRGVEQLLRGIQDRIRALHKDQRK